MPPYPIKRKTPTAGLQAAVEGSVHGCSQQPKPMRRGSPCTFALPTRPVLFHRRTDDNPESHGAVNPPEQKVAPPPASNPRLAGQPGRAGQPSPAGRMQSCARDSCAPLGSYKQAVCVQVIVPAGIPIGVGQIAAIGQLYHPAVIGADNFHASTSTGSQSNR